MRNAAVGLVFNALAESRGGVVLNNQNPTASGVGGVLVQGVGEGGVAALDSRNGDGVLFADGVV